MIEQRLIDPLKPLNRWLGGYRIAELWQSQTRPRPQKKRGQATFLTSSTDALANPDADEGTEIDIFLDERGKDYRARW